MGGFTKPNWDATPKPHRLVRAITMSDSEKMAAERARRTLDAASQAVSANLEWATRVCQNWGYNRDSASDLLQREQIDDEKTR